MKNKEYYSDAHHGYWKILSTHSRCAGDFIAGTKCNRELVSEEVVLFTGHVDFDNVPLYLCKECAEKEV